jgi:hypothetical protein
MWVVYVKEYHPRLVFIFLSLSLFKMLLCEHGTCWGKEEKGKNLPNQISIFSNGSLLMPWWEMMFFSRSRAPLLSRPLYPVFLFSHLDRVSMLKSTNPSWQRASCVSDVHRLLRDVEIGARESQENTKKNQVETTQSIEIGLLLVEKKMKINPKKERESEWIKKKTAEMYKNTHVSILWGGWWLGKRVKHVAVISTRQKMFLKMFKKVVTDSRCMNVMHVCCIPSGSPRDGIRRGENRVYMRDATLFHPHFFKKTEIWGKKKNITSFYIQQVLFVTTLLFLCSKDGK